MKNMISKLFLVAALATIVLSLDISDKKPIKITKIEGPPSGFWKIRFEWKSHWVREWKQQMMWVSMWKRVWTPLQIREWVPQPHTPPDWKAKEH